MLAVSHSDQSWIVASMVQSPYESDAFALGMWLWGPPHPHRAPGQALRVQDGEIPEPHPHLLAHEFQIPASNGDFQSKRWTVVSAIAGTMCHHAGQIW